MDETWELSPSILLNALDNDNVFLTQEDVLFMKEEPRELKRKHEELFEEWFTLTPIDGESSYTEEDIFDLNPEMCTKRRKIEEEKFIPVTNREILPAFEPLIYPTATTTILMSSQTYDVLKFTPKKKQTIILQAIFTQPVQKRISLRIVVDDDIFLRYGKRSLKPRQKSTLMDDCGTDPYTFQLTGFLNIDNVPQKEDLQIKTLEKKNERTFNVIIEAGATMLEIPIEVKIVKPQSNDKNQVVLQLVNSRGTYLQWNNKVLIQGSRRKTKSNKDSELSECFGPIWNVVDVELALLNKKNSGADESIDIDEMLADSDLFPADPIIMPHVPAQMNTNMIVPAYEGYNLPTVNTADGMYMYRPLVNMVTDMYNRAERNMSDTTNNVAAMQLYNQYLECKYQVRSPIDVLNIIQQQFYNVFDERDISCFLRLADLYCRYNKDFQSTNYHMADELSERCLQLCGARQSDALTLRAAYRCAENDLYKGYQGLQYLATIQKCDRGLALVQICNSRGNLKELEAEMYNLKGVTLSRMHGFTSGVEQRYVPVDENELQERINIVGEILKCKHRVFEIRQQLDPKSSSFAQICNNVSASLMSYYYLFRRSQQYTAKKAVSILNVVKRVQSRAVSIQKQANANVQHLAYALYKYRLKLCEFELGLESREAGEDIDDQKIEKLREERDKCKEQYDHCNSQFVHK
jgi:hypothetical protein